MSEDNLEEEEGYITPGDYGFEGERTVSTSFRQGFGFCLGAAAALVFLFIVSFALAYLAVEGGFLSWDEILMFR